VLFWVEKAIGIYPGQYFDEETGLHQNRFRYYDGSLGRYLESDPIGLHGGLNRYRYVSNNSLRYFDPLGLCRKKGESKFVCADRVAKEVLGSQLELIDSFGYWGIGAWAVSGEIGNASLTSFAETVASDAIKSSRTAGAREAGDILSKIAAAEKASKIAAGTAALKTGLATVSKASGIMGLAATGSSAVDRMLGYYYGDCSEECTDCK
jgi:RHS repeat-associated protein